MNDMSSNDFDHALLVEVTEFLVRGMVLPKEHRTGLITSVRAAWPACDNHVTSETNCC
jgi:hypothetical protein